MFALYRYRSHRISAPTPWSIRQFRRALGIMIGIGLIGLLFVSLLLPVQAIEQTNTVYLPLIQRPKEPNAFGIETASLNRNWLRDRAESLGSTWVRLNTVSWRDVQPDNAATFNWDVESIQTFESELQAANQAGLTPMVIVDDYPDWATQRDGNAGRCSPIKPEHLSDFAAFAQQLALRYGQDVTYWEMGNEPDVDPDLAFFPDLFGCWGDIDDPYYGGEYYGEMLKVVTPAIKQVAPSAQVMIGGLLLDSPDSNATNPGFGQPEKFLEGILRSGADSSFDIVAFHGYPCYMGANIDADLNHPNWAAEGGVNIGKAQFLKNVLASYGVSKPLMLNEVSLLLCGENPTVSEAFLQTQASYVPRVLSRARSEDVQAIVWYTLEGPGWRSGGLLAGNDSRPSFDAYQQFIKRIGASGRPTRLPDSEYTPQVEAYRFATASGTVDVLWSNDDQTYPVDVFKEVFRGAETRDGEPKTVIGLDQPDTPRVLIEIGFEPVYILR
ncbi:MAG: glycoside hydrolase family 5 protein [Chloroflexaceae bacterium]|nr:glycoside hydrolase family 5 protein [Chloroflexaceae bacterium]